MIALLFLYEAEEGLHEPSLYEEKRERSPMKHYTNKCTRCGALTKVEDTDRLYIAECASCKGLTLICRTSIPLDPLVKDATDKLRAIYLNVLLEEWMKKNLEQIYLSPLSLLERGTEEKEEEKKEEEKKRPITTGDLNVFRQQLKGLDYEDYFKENIG